MKISEKVSPNGGCYVTIKANDREWSSYYPTPPTEADIRAIEGIEVATEKIDRR